jgi:aldehyde:ferredoxin oxidoreductase
MVDFAVNLSNKSIGTERFDEAFYRTYMGAQLIQLLQKELNPWLIRFSRQHLGVCSGALTGARVGGDGRYAVEPKSPLTSVFRRIEAVIFGPN